VDPGQHPVVHPAGGGHLRRLRVHLSLDAAHHDRLCRRSLQTASRPGAMTPLDELARLVLLATRPGVLVLATPIFGGQYAPTLMRVGLPVLIALLIAPVVPVPQPLPAAGLVFVMARELAIGLALAMAIRALI